VRGASWHCSGTRIRTAAVRLQHSAPPAGNATDPLQHPLTAEDAAKKFREVTDAYKLLSRGEDACKGYEELAAENEMVREALSRAMEMAARFEEKLAASSSEPSPSDPKHTVMQVGAATWVGEPEGGRPHGSGDLILPNGAVHHTSPSPTPSP
jgi:hypothetical protein